ncbi:hypothetical protein V8G57_11525 [Collimonas sp. H4R21]|uniref:Ubiquitin-like domain-containing protein n=1 Tax=Collimonas rhizosphaerae TaxID=3126357 RepID=A0ABU9PVI0_9BURK
MTTLVVFIQVQGRPGIIETKLGPATTIGELKAALAAVGVNIDVETFIYVEDAENHLHGEHHEPAYGVKHGCRIHVSRCKRIRATVHYLDKTETRDFAPGARIRAVKAHAVDVFHIPPKDAGEHVLQLCNSQERPASDTPLHTLADHNTCAVCFDLVPEKRIEG